MRFPTSLVAVCGAALAALACGDEGCGKPLSDYCTTDCPTYDQAREEARQTGITSGGMCFFGQAGTCGALRYVATSGGFGGPEYFFDQAGTLVAAHVSTDTNSYCGGKSFSQDYGPVPACDRVVEEDFCAQ